MKKIMILCFATILSVIGAKADNVNVSNVIVDTDQTTTVAVCLNNENTGYVSFQMDLTLPEGITINKAGCSLTSRITDTDQELTIGKQGDKVYRLTSTSFSLSPITGNSGELIILSLSASAGSNGGQATLTNIRFATANSERVTMDDVSFNITVIKPSAIVTTAPTAKTLTYTGSAQQLVDAGVASGGTIQYSLDGTSYSTNIPTGTNAETYTVYYKVVGDANHSNSNPATISVTINAKDASNLTISSIGAVTYNGLAQTPAVTVKDELITLTSGTDYTISYSDNTNAGTATVTVTGMRNYTGTKTATFVINKAPLTITAKDYTIKQGEVIPAFEATYEGFKNSETSAVLMKQPIIMTDATSASDPGQYDITVSGAEAHNYDFTYVKGKLTIEAPDIIPGDANGDGNVNATDISDIVNQMIDKPTTTGKYSEKAADANGDNTVNIADIIMIVNIVVGN